MSTTTLSPPENGLEMMALAGARRVTVEQYHEMHEAGISRDGDRVELIEGYVLEKHGRTPPHETALRWLTARLPRRLPPGWFLQIQGVIELPDSEPEPDGALLRGDETTCDGRLPTPADIVMVVEISDSSRAFDRRVKGRVYSRAGIPVFWVVNVVDRVIEVYADPDPRADPPAYRARADYAPGDAVPLVLDGAAAGAVPVAELLP